MRRLMGKIKTAHIIAVALLISVALAAHPGLGDTPPEQEKVLEVDYKGGLLTIKAVQAEAVKLLQKIAEEAHFKLAMPGFPKELTLDIRFSDLPLEKGILRIIRALQNQAGVSHVAVYQRRGGEDYLYSLRVSYSTARRPPTGPLPAPAKIIKRPPKQSLKRISAREKVKKEKEKQAAQVKRKKIRRRFFQELIDNLQEEGWTREEIEGHIRSLKDEPEEEEKQ